MMAAVICDGLGVVFAGRVSWMFSVGTNFE